VGTERVARAGTKRKGNKEENVQRSPLEVGSRKSERLPLEKNRRAANNPRKKKGGGIEGVEGKKESDLEAQKSVVPGKWSPNGIPQKEKRLKSGGWGKRAQSQKKGKRGGECKRENRIRGRGGEGRGLRVALSTLQIQIDHKKGKKMGIKGEKSREKEREKEKK